MKGRILVVDDDRLVLATLAHGLAQAGWDVIDADNGDDAILLARQHRPDLALLDIRMEGKSGFDVALYLRDQLRIPFMFLSAFADDDTMRQVRALGAISCLVKPLDIGQIVPAVEAAMTQVRARGAPAPAAPRPPWSGHEIVWIAVGVLMHRYSLSREQALDRLSRLADEDALALPEQSRRLVESVELLARPGQGRQ